MGCIVYKSDRSSIEAVSYLHFFETKSRYYNDVLKSVDDWVLFYVPRNGSSSSYYCAGAKVAALDQGNTPGAVRVLVKDFDWFARDVPAFGEFVYEQELVGQNWRSLVMRAVRRLSEAECLAIAEDGFAPPQPQNTPPGLLEAAPFYIPEQRPKETTYRLLRDLRLRAEHRVVYRGVCSLTGVCQPDGHGGFEAQCAHILPVAEGGPDIITNTLCLSATFHWCWDNGLVALDDDYRIKSSSLLCEALQKQLLASGQAIVPMSASMRPRPEYLRWHREKWAHRFS